METKALMIGGVFPSVLLGTGTVLMKLSLKNGISLSMCIVIGATIVSSSLNKT